ncbi:hypothetical protein XENORESO_002586 [Xenotaenia resolanae]|uniref:PiggyBac transposable element-derived protein domain-containing protein n=1 Tax=Xenotaenia resolanae TaxID=208358 RepID=A0ABV0WJY1_9TELE
MQVSQHSVELKVQLLTGRKGVRVGEVWVDKLRRVPCRQTQNFIWKIKDIIKDYVPEKHIYCINSLYTGTVYWGVMSTLHAESKGSFFHFLQHTLKKPAVKAQTNTDLTINVCNSTFPCPLLQIFTLQEQNNHMHSRC